LWDRGVGCWERPLHCCVYVCVVGRHGVCQGARWQRWRGGAERKARRDGGKWVEGRRARGEGGGGRY
jgi:hypothetical protein